MVRQIISGKGGNILPWFLRAPSHDPGQRWFNHGHTGGALYGPVLEHDNIWTSTDFGAWQSKYRSQTEYDLHGGSGYAEYGSSLHGTLAA